jgi:glycosyltransferase involved in cell wall biosynthesis
MDNPRLLCVARWPVGGIRTYLHYVYPALAADGYVFTFAGPPDERFRRFREELRHWPNVEFVELPCERTRDSVNLPLRRLLASGRFDLVHSQGATSAVQTAIANLGLRVPHVMTSHDVFRPDQFAGRLGRLKRRVMGELFRGIDLIIHVTNDARENLLEYLPRVVTGRARMATIGHGIDTNRFCYPPRRFAQTLREQMRIDQSTFLMGFLGRFMEQKGFLPLLSALEQLPAHGWRLAAFGAGDMIREYQAETGRRRLANRVSFFDLATVPESVIPQLDLVVMPSLWEAAGLLAMETLCLGTPLVASDCPGLSEVLTDTPAAMVAAGGSDALAAALRRAMTGELVAPTRRFAPEAGRRYCSQRSAAALLLELNQLLGRPGRLEVASNVGGKASRSASTVASATEMSTTVGAI